MDLQIFECNCEDVNLPESKHVARSFALSVAIVCVTVLLIVLLA